MCQAISEGGRRCPIHRRETILTMSHLDQTTSLNPEQTKQIFLDLRREGRGLRLKGLESYWHGYLDSLEINASERARQEIEVIRKGEAPDSATLYALRNLGTRARRKSAALADALDDISRRKGWTLDSTKKRFEQEYQSLVTSSQRSIPRVQMNEAREFGLPADRFTVGALSSLEQQPVERESVRRVQLETLSDGTQAGYHKGRLEAILPQQNRAQALVYRNVEQDTWESLQQAQNPAQFITNSLVGESHYQYPSDEEARADAYQIKCEACGQFIVQSGSHDCPAVQTNEAEDDESSEPNEEAIQAQLVPPRREQPEPDYKSSETSTYVNEPLNLQLIEAQEQDGWFPTQEAREMAQKLDGEPLFAARALMHYNKQTREVEYLGRYTEFERVMYRNSERREWVYEYYRITKGGEELEPSTEEKVNEAAAWIDEQEEAGNLVIVPANATASRRYKVDGNYFLL